LRLICESRHAQGKTLRRRPTIEELFYNPRLPNRGFPRIAGQTSSQ